MTGITLETKAYIVGKAPELDTTRDLLAFKNGKVFNFKTGEISHCTPKMNVLRPGGQISDDGRVWHSTRTGARLHAHEVAASGPRRTSSWPTPRHPGAPGVAGARRAEGCAR